MNSAKANRKECKRRSRHAVKRHYGMYLIACLLAALLGTEFRFSLIIFKNSSATADVSEPEAENAGLMDTDESIFDMIIEDITLYRDTWYKLTGAGKSAAGEDSAAAEPFSDAVPSETESRLADTENTTAVNESFLDRTFAQRRGVFASLVRTVTSGTLISEILMALRSMTGSRSLATILLIILSLFASFLVWFFIKNIYAVIIRRLFLEGRLYDRVSFQRFLFLGRVNAILRTAVNMFILAVYDFLWALTIVGIPIKHYSYLMVPYILAENPSMNANEAITLSRKMMNGHKWEYFINDLTFAGWFVLDLVTFGLSDIFFTNSYRTAYFAECYALLRSEAKTKKLPCSDLLCDTYLFTLADDDLLAAAYAPIEELIKMDLSDPEELQHGFRAFVARWLGISLLPEKVCNEYERRQALRLRIKKYQAAIDKQAYPMRLNPVPEELRNPRVITVNYMRIYPLTSIASFFFIFSIIGWCWEVGQHFIVKGEFANRGVLLGPWLPIYGCGGVFILVVLTRFRKNPAAEFLAAITLSGILEYCTAFALEAIYHEKWWDYTGYFLNLHGRICAEGLLVFGVGGCIVVYMIAPLLDNRLRKINRKLLRIIVVALLCLFAADMAHSSAHPNVGRGITDISENPVDDVIVELAEQNAGQT